MTTTSTTPEEPAGLVAVHDVVVQETFVAAFAPNLIDEPEALKFAPLIVTTVPPAVAPEVGLILVTDGTGVT